MLINQQNYMISKENYFKRPSYKFFLSELKPVSQVQLINPGHAAFWYDGENQLDVPTQSVSGYEDIHLFEIERPYVTDHSFHEILNREGSKGAVRELNRRIARYLIKEYRKQHEALPQSRSALYLEKTEMFYTWFWKQEKNANKPIPAFLKEFRKERNNQNNPRIWHNVREAATYLGCSDSLIRKAIREGKLKANRHDPDSEKSTYSIHRKNLDAYMLFHRSKLTRPQMEELDWLNK